MSSHRLAAKTPEGPSARREDRPSARNLARDGRHKTEQLNDLQRTAGNQAVGALLEGGPTTELPDLRAVTEGQGGEPLAQSLREAMEARFAHDFSGVRVHQGTESRDTARVLGARAFTIGEHVWLGEGAHTSDLTLLSHEFTHVVQQQRGREAGLPSAPWAINRSAALEAEAAGAPTAGPVAVSGAAGASVQRQEVVAEGAPGVKVRVEDVPEGAEIFLDDRSIAIVQGSGVNAQSVHATAALQPAVAMESGGYATSQLKVNVLHPAGAIASPDVNALDELRGRGYEVLFNAGEEAVSRPQPARRQQRASRNAPAPEPSPEELEIHKKLAAIDQEVSSTSMTEERQLALQNEREQLLYELEGAKQGMSLAPPPQVAALPAPPPPERPRQMDMSIDPGSLTGPELETDTLALRDWLVDHPYDQDASLGAHELSLYEAELAKRTEVKTQLRGAAQKLKEETKKRLEGAGALERFATMVQMEKEAENFFALSVLAGMYEYIPSNDYEKLKNQSAEDLAMFAVGINIGFAKGAVLQLKDDIVGIGELVVMLAENVPIVGPWSASDLSEMAQLGIPGYFMEQQAKAERRRAIVKGIYEFAKKLAEDPTLLLDLGQELGDMLGQYFGKKFHEFVEMSPFDRGEVLGDFAGRVAFEIALLFLGPEEWIARGATAAAKIAEVAKATRLGQKIYEILRGIEALRPLLKAAPEVQKLAKGAEEAVVVGKGVEEASQLGKLGEAGELAKGGDAAGELSKADELLTKGPEGASELSKGENVVPKEGVPEKPATLEKAETPKAVEEAPPTKVEEPPTKVEEPPKKVEVEPKSKAEEPPAKTAEPPAETAEPTKTKKSSGRGKRASTRPFMNESLKKITGAGVDESGKLKHPLGFLLEKAPDGSWQWRTTTRVTKSGKVQKGRYLYQGGEAGPIVQGGHPGAYASGAEQTFALEDVERNLSGGALIESKGGYSFKPSVVLGDIPVEISTAMEWERLGLLPPGTVENAQIIQAPFIK